MVEEISYKQLAAKLRSLVATLMERPDLEIVDAIIKELEEDKLLGCYLSPLIKRVVWRVVLKRMNRDSWLPGSAEVVCYRYLNQISQCYELETKSKMPRAYVFYYRKDRAKIIRVVKKFRALCIEAGKKEN